MLIVALRELPVGALIEVETICITQKASTCLELKLSMIENDAKLRPQKFVPSLGWNTGHDFDCENEFAPPAIRLTATTASVGCGCAAMCTVSASSATGEHVEFIDPEMVLSGNA
jgi:hypothetical protein